MKYVFSRAAALFLVAAIFALTVQATPQLSASCHILMDADTGMIISSNQCHKRALIASTTKIMTAVVVLENMAPTSQIVVPTESVGVEGSSMYLKEGECLTVLDLLYGLLLHSGNDAAVALAVGCCGSVPAFVNKMNEKAQELSLQNTHFENPNGLDGKEHYSSAYDLGCLTAYALKIPEFRQIVSCKTIQIGTRSLRNHNRLLWMEEGIIGVKTGYTKASGRILVSAMEYQGRTMIAVTINDGNDWQDHLSLYQYGKTCYKDRILIEKGSFLGDLPLMEGTKGFLYSEERLSACLLDGEQPLFRIKYPLYPMGSTGISQIDVYIGNLYIGRISAHWEGTYNGTTTKNHSLPRSLLTSYR